MNDYYLKALDKEALDSALEAAGLIVEGRVVTASETHALVVIGTIYEETGNIITDSEGTEYPEKQAVPGSHANFRGEFLPEPLVPLSIPAPSSPAWAWL